MMRAIERLRRSVALMICPELGSVEVGSPATARSSATTGWRSTPTLGFVRRSVAMKPRKSGCKLPKGKLNRPHDP
ncbi:hypothetical protein [Phaeovulum veldkampii]|uniref:hypothetical protein n=1 Tax=Phaeovulum veldkampii TaxID=33049 RepID=UPI00105D6477|nr:hypothetical protein [Phaeovulum veldkampii]TDQ64649.1 hypothetical protein EV658_101112 [Phaeovulum veldkampii DSM 11550]